MRKVMGLAAAFALATVQAVETVEERQFSYARMPMAEMSGLFRQALATGDRSALEARKPEILSTFRHLEHYVDANGSLIRVPTWEASNSQLSTLNLSYGELLVLAGRMWNRRDLEVKGRSVGREVKAKGEVEEWRFSPLWNRKATLFMEAPTLAFAPVNGAARYCFRVTDDAGRVHAFEAPSATASLESVWEKLPPGVTSVLALGVDAQGSVCGIAGERRFWKSASFLAGSYPRPPRTYAQAKKLLYRYILELPDVRRMETVGAPDLARRDNFASYPSKMQSALIQTMLAARAVLPAEADRALAIAKRSADYLISLQCAEGTPLAGFTPTYAGDGQLSGTYGGQNMLDYPHVAGSAFLALYRATNDAKYLAAATRVADCYLRLQGADGTWFLKLNEKDGSPAFPNRLVPIGVICFLEEMFAATGKTNYRAAADRAFGFIEKGPLTDWNWEGQFEDIRPAATKYDNLTHHFVCQTARYLLKRFPGDAKRLAQVRAILHFAEDQFVVWESPVRSDGIGATESPRYPYAVWRTPAVLEQYMCYSPIDSSAANLILTFLAYSRATGDKTALAKARALGDSMVVNQDPSGRIRTYWICETKEETPLAGSFRPPRGGDWLNCMAEDAEALEDLSLTIGDCPRQ